MNQMNFDSYLNGQKELIHCPVTDSYHWIRITSGHTPEEARNRIHFILEGYDYLYEDSKGKDEILNEFDGSIKTITWEEAIGYDEQSETEQSGPAVATRNDS